MFKRFLKVFISFFIIFIIIFAVAYKYNYIDIKDNSSESVNFLLIGVDILNSEDSTNARSDTLMVFNVDKSTGKISILSIPRDTRTPIAGRKYQEKINHAYAYGGPELTLSTISNLLGIDLNYYVIVDYNMVKELVDTVGGVEIDVSMDMKYEDPTSNPPLYIDIKEGLQTLDGDKSLQFLRYRKGYKSADLGRIEAQQMFMKSMLKEILSPINIIKIPKFIKIYNENINTNIPLEVVATYAMKFNTYDLTNMDTKILPGEANMINGLSYFVHSKDKTKDLVREMFKIEEDIAIIFE